MARNTAKEGGRAKAASVRRSVDSFEEAAAKARVPVEVFRLWMLKSARGYNHKQWSAWENRRRPIPDKYVIAFLHDRDDSV